MADGFNIKEFFGRFEAVALVTVVTAIVWIIAEGETQHNDTISLNIVFEGTTDLAITPKAPIPIQIEFKCPTNRVDDLRSLATAPVRIPLQPDDSTTERVIDLSETLNQLTAIRDIKVTIVSADPPSARVHVERIKPFQAPVVVESGDVQLTGVPTREPQSVTVHMTQSQRDLIDGDLTVVARLADIPDITSIAKGEEVTRDVPVTLPGNIGVSGASAEPATVSVSFTIDKQQATAVIPSVPIYIRVPVLESGKYLVRPDNNQPLLTDNVELTGPRAIIDQIKKSEIPVFAELRLTSDDLETLAGKPSVTRQLDFDVPAGVVVTPHQVTFSIEKKPVTTTPE